MEITYTRIGDHMIPDIVLSDPPDAPPLGRYGMMHKEYLRREKPALYASLLRSERLYPLCQEIDQAALTGSPQSPTAKRRARSYSAN